MKINNVYFMMENDAGIGWDVRDMSLLTWLELENYSDASLVIDRGSALNSVETINTIHIPAAATYFQATILLNIFSLLWVKSKHKNVIFAELWGYPYQKDRSNNNMFAIVARIFLDASF